MPVAPGGKHRAGMSSQLSSWLSGEDVTTPAHDRHRTVEAPPDASPHRGRTTRVDALVFLAAVWLLIASVPVAYVPTGRFDVFWNDAVVGTAVGVVTMIRLVGSGVPDSTAGITGALGGWLVAAPFVLGYGDTPAGRLARWDDIAIGAAIVVLSLATLAAARIRSTAEPVPPGSPGLIVGGVEPAD
jgi:hypothetical protein